MIAAPITELVAEFLYRTRHPKPLWGSLPEHTKDGYRAIVGEVLLAAMNAGLAIQEYTPPVPGAFTVRLESGPHCDRCGAMGVPLQEGIYGEGGGTKHTSSLCPKCKNGALRK